MNTNTQEDLGKLVLRVTLGVLVLLHGIAKITGGVEGIEGMLAGQGLPRELAYGAYVGEVLGPILVIAGFHARVGAVLIAINMLFAIWLAHMGELTRLGDQGGWALELQGMYLGTAVAIALIGAGRYSINGR
ncbi:MAG: DoxX family protein [Pseudomonadota bacterium]|nr:DoxX family protein [Pseudomonadota bacterium]